MFIGRESELEALNQMYMQDKFQLFVLYGRRRVGKTTLLKSISARLTPQQGEMR